jgi:curved DNA-binding protein CbpA
MKSYYDLLGVAPNAAVADIEKAFFKLKALHPADRVASDQSIKFRFQGIEQAFQTLSDPGLRSQYDAKLQAALKSAAHVEKAQRGPGMGPALVRGLVIGTIALVIAAVAGYFIHSEIKRQELAEQVRLQRALEEKRKEAEERALEAEKIRLAKDEEDRRLAVQRDGAYANTPTNDAQRLSREADREAFSQRIDKSIDKAFSDIEKRRREAAEQRKREVERDRAEEHMAKQRALLREQCMTRYGRPDC